MLAIQKMDHCLFFSATHEGFVTNVTILSVAASASQYFIYTQIQEYGALVFAATMNVRQIASILVSYASFHHSITFLQLHGIMLIFASLFFKSFASLQGQAKAKGLQEKTPLNGNAGLVF